MNAKLIRNGLFFSILSAIQIFIGVEQAFAKPELKPLDTNIADMGSAYYQFKIKEFQSIDQQRKYRVWLAIPKHLSTLNTSTQYSVQSTQGVASLFMLDGNSVMSRLNEPLLKTLAAHDAPVLVAMGYQTNLPFESASRSLDYTPADVSGLPSKDPRNPERMSGGSSQFRELIVSEIMPWVESEVRLDPQRKALWGHSYGGLFVLDSALNSRQFAHYFAASPSLGWADQRIVKKIEQATAEQLKNQKLWIMEGDIDFDTLDKISPNADKNMIQNNRNIVQIMATKGSDVRLILYPHLSHGEVFQRSLMDVLNYRLF